MLPTERAVWAALQTVSDPEYPMSVVDLGLICDVAVAGETVTIAMTLTSIGCPAIDMIVADVQDAVRARAGAARVNVEIVWSPPWTKERISRRGRRVLAAHGVVA